MSLVVFTYNHIAIILRNFGLNIKTFDGKTEKTETECRNVVSCNMIWCMQLFCQMICVCVRSFLVRFFWLHLNIMVLYLVYGYFLGVKIMYYLSFSKCSLGTPGSKLFSLRTQTRLLACFTHSPTGEFSRGCMTCEDITPVANSVCVCTFFSSFSFLVSKTVNVNEYNPHRSFLVSSINLSSESLRIAALED